MNIKDERNGHRKEFGNLPIGTVFYYEPDDIWVMKTTLIINCDEDECANAVQLSGFGAGQLTYFEHEDVVEPVKAALTVTD